MERVRLEEAVNGWIVVKFNNDFTMEKEIYASLEDAQDALNGHIDKLKRPLSAA